MRRKTPHLILSGALVCCVLCCIVALGPLNHNVVPFLFLYSLMFVVYVVSLATFCRSIEKTANPTEKVQWKSLSYQPSPASRFQTISQSQHYEPDPNFRRDDDIRQKGASPFDIEPSSTEKLGLNNSDTFQKIPWSVVLIVGFGLLFRAIMFFSPPSLSDDIFRYVWDGRVQQAGLNPYHEPPNSENLKALKNEEHALINHPSLRTIYPPLAQVVFYLGAALSNTFWSQKLLFILFDFALIFLLIFFLRHKNRPEQYVLVYAWNPLVIIEVAGSGHLDSLMMFWWSVGLFLFERRSRFQASMALAASVMSKWIALIMVPWLIVTRRWRETIVFIAMCVLLLIPFISGISSRFPIEAVLSPQSNVTSELLTNSEKIHLDKLGQVKSDNNGTPIFGQGALLSVPLINGFVAYGRDWVFNPSLYAIVKVFLGSAVFSKLMLALMFIVFSFVWSIKTKNEPILTVLGLLILLLLISPVVHPWYVMWLVPLVCFFRLWSVILWSWLVVLTYVVQIGYTTTGLWHLPDWVGWTEYGVFYVVFSIELVGIIHRSYWKKIGVNSLRLEPIKNPVIGIVIPVLNEEQALPLVLSDIAKFNVERVVVVDNGSTDRSAELARRNGAFVVSENRRGYGQAVQTGLQHLPKNVNIVVIIDADHSDFPEDLPSLVNPIIYGQAHFVIGCRGKMAEKGSLRPQQRFGNWLASTVIRFLYGRRFSDFGPFRALRRDVLDGLNLIDPNYGWNVEMQIKALQKALVIQEVPVRYRGRVGVSKISGSLKGSLNAGIVILWSLWRYGVKWVGLKGYKTLFFQ